MDSIVHGVTKSRTQLSDFHFCFHVNVYLTFLAFLFAIHKF